MYNQIGLLTHSFIQKYARLCLVGLILCLSLLTVHLFRNVFTKPTVIRSEISAPKEHELSRKSQCKAIFAVTFFLIASLSLFCFLDKKTAVLFGPFYFFLFAIAAQLSYLYIHFSPEWSSDIRSYLLSGPLRESPGCNLNYGLYMASNVLQGKGPVICDLPPWCRMPGYGFFLALAGNPSNLLQMALNGIGLQILFFSLSLMFFFYTSLRIMTPLTAAIIATVISFFSYHFHQTYIESVMPSLILYLAAIGCLWTDRFGKSEVIPLKLHLLLHFGFAAWFALRTDILPAWGLLSLILYGKNFQTWKYLLIPLSLSLTIGLSWAFFKFPLTGEFCMTTNSVGCSLMVGLWEVPHKFIWTISDETYFSWMKQLKIPVESKEGSDFAVKEVFRFCATYPFYTFSVVLHKLLFYLKSFSFAPFNIQWKSLYLLIPLTLSISLKYKRFQTFIFSWPILFNVPIFFLFYSSSGRFYLAPTISLIIASFALLLDPGFYRKIMNYRKKTALILLSFMAFIWLGPALDNYLLKNDKLRYWAPFLDPNLSTLNRWAKQDGC